MVTKYEWFVPDTLTVTDPKRQGPTVVPSEDGMSDVIVGTSWALRGTADDGTVVVMNSYTPIAAPDPTNYTHFDDVSPEHLQLWLFGPPDGSGTLNKADQQGQMDDKLKAKQRSKQEVGQKPLNPDAVPPASIEVEQKAAPGEGEQKDNPPPPPPP